MPWPAMTDCRALLAAITALPEESRQRLDPTVAPVAVTVVDQGQPLLPADAAGALTMDLPVSLAGGREPPCLLLVERTPTSRTAPRQPLAHTIVQSTYRRGNQRIANPKHAELRRTIRALDEQDDDIIATGDPTIDLIGIVAGGILNGVGSIWRSRAEAEARAELAATPASLAETVWEPYTYQVTTLEAERTGVLRAALVDRRLGHSWPLEQTVRERHRFNVATGRVPKDRGLLEGRAAELVTSADVTVWEQGGLQPSISWLAAALAATEAAGAEVDGAAVTAAWAASPMRPAAPTMTQADVEPVDELKALSPRPAAQAGVELVTSADGIRRYRVVEPAAGVGSTSSPVMAEP